MKRRQALVSIGMVVAGFRGIWSHAGAQQTTTAAQSSFTALAKGPMVLSLHLTDVERIDVVVGDRKVSVTPKEVMDALLATEARP